MNRFLSGFFGVVGFFCVQSEGIAQSLTYTSLFQLQSGSPNTTQVAAFNSLSKKLEIYQKEKVELKLIKEIPVNHIVMTCVMTPHGIVIGSGAGRGDLTAPMRVSILPQNGGEPATVFEQLGERNQITAMKWLNNRLWITFFESKFFTKTGYLERNSSGSWIFTEKFSVRMGDSAEFTDDGVVVGRSYGDILGQDGDAQLHQEGNSVTVLPTYRGVRSVATLSSQKPLSFLVGDGWHQNYNQFGQARISLIKKDNETSRYTTQLIDNDTTQYSFSRLIPFNSGPFNSGAGQYALAVGNRDIILYGSAPSWSKKVVYSRTNEQAFYDAAIVSVDEKEVWIAVLDQKIALLKVTL